MTLTFENCESVEIPFKFINHFNISNITQELVYNSQTGEVRTQLNTDALYILFKKSFSVYTIETNCGDNAYDRIKRYQDICWIDIQYEDNTIATFGVKWPDLGYNMIDNPNQSSTSHFDGLLVEIYNK